MNERTWMQRSGATPGKLALVGCLSIGLGFVLWSQHSDEVEQLVVSENPTPKPTLQQPTSEKLVSENKGSEAEKTSAQKLKVWPVMPLEEVIVNDPFVRPGWYLAASTETPIIADRSSENVEQQIEELRQEQTKIVMISNGNKIASIGKESYRIGDTIAGFQVTEINRDGVVLTEIE